jgi:exopolysaccharide biosynthesis WecB/TagA/CpsF family protein
MALQRVGIDAIVFEGHPRATAEVGSYFTVSTNGLAALDVIDAQHIAVEVGFPTYKNVMWNDRGQRLATIPLGAPLPERITGTDLVLGCAQMAALEGHRLFLLGAAPGVAEQAATELQRRFPGLTVCGIYAPPFGPWAEDEDRRIVERVQAARPDVLFVAFGAPRQDVWIREHMAELNVPVSIGIGGTLNFLAGKIRRAPQWMQDFGLEWLYRVMQEPGRLWKRYLLEDLPIFFQLLAQARVTPNEALTEEAPAFSHRFAITADATPVSVELTPR